ncbi:DUF6946 family protein [Chachezhania sediminis]|uniref:DUF6946 family protein n=1 Tax=Chachezhania sediminis TaxID=2599291 RepID=UPI001E489D91|nr:hypothetical protein [Chachezhania sediminis]
MAQGLPPEIAAVLGPEAELLLAIPEYKVALPGGGRQTQCDVFALVRIGGDTCAVSIEAKVAEPFGPTVGQWMADASAGKARRLAFLAALLGLSDIPRDIRYQLLHRTAAAVLEAERFKTDSAAMIVQSFSPDARWFPDYHRFVQLFGKTTEPDRRVDVALPSGRPLILGWACAEVVG